MERKKSFLDRTYIFFSPRTFTVHSRVTKLSITYYCSSLTEHSHVVKHERMYSIDDKQHRKVK